MRVCTAHDFGFLMANGGRVYEAEYAMYALLGLTFLNS